MTTLPCSKAARSYTGAPARSPLLSLRRVSLPRHLQVQDGNLPLLQEARTPNLCLQKEGPRPEGTDRT